MRNKQKLIMFDFGGVTEVHDKGAGIVYDYKAVILDAIRYSTGLCCYDYDDLNKADVWLWGQYCKDSICDSVQRSITSERELTDELGRWLATMSGSASYNCDYYTRKFLAFINERVQRTRFRPEVVSLQKRLKEFCLVGGMTNIAYYWSNRFHQITDEIEYDVTWESFKVGFLKPEKAAFKSVEAMSGLEGKSILLFDDSEENVRAALDNGWYAHKVEQKDVRLQIQMTAMGFIDDDQKVLKAISSYPA